MKKVLTFGVFDFFHLGHLRLFKNILKMGGGGVYLIVAVQQDNCIKKYKPDTRVLYSTQERIEILKSIREIDEVIVYTFVDESIKHIDFDILAIGSDQTNPSFQKCFEYCKNNGKKILTIPRTEGISSRNIKMDIK